LECSLPPAPLQSVGDAAPGSPRRSRPRAPARGTRQARPSAGRFLRSIRRAEPAPLLYRTPFLVISEGGEARNAFARSSSRTAGQGTSSVGTRKSWAAAVERYSLEPSFSDPSITKT